MQLNEILEENSIEDISSKTNIAEDNLQYLIEKDFASINMQKALGFISIIEREYNVDLSNLRDEAKVYYKEFAPKQGIVPIMPTMKSSKGGSRLFIFVVLLLLGYASWFFISKFDKKDLNSVVPFFKTSQSVNDLNVSDSFTNVVEKNKL